VRKGRKTKEKPMSKAIRGRFVDARGEYVAPLASIVLAAALAVSLGGCSDKEESRPSPAVATLSGRAEDADYQKALDAEIEVRRGLESALASARKAYEEAKKADPDGEVAKELEAKFRSCAEAVEAHKKKAAETVRSRIWKDLNDAEAAKAAAAKDGKAEK